MPHRCSAPRRGVPGRTLAALGGLAVLGGLLAGAPAASAATPSTEHAPSAQPAVVPYATVAAYDAGAQRPALGLGQTLRPGTSLVSPNHRWSLRMNPDGALLHLQAPNRLLAQPAAVDLAGPGSPGSVLVLQSDGDLVLRAADGSVRHDYGTQGSGAQSLTIRDDGDVVLLDAGGAVVLDLRLGDAGDVLESGRVMLPGDTRVSPDGSTVLTMQRDGDLVVRTDGQVRFASGTAGHPGAAAVLQADGNLVVYGVHGKALFATGTVAVRAGFAYLAVELGGFRVFAGASGAPASYSSTWSSDTLRPGEALVAGDRRTSLGGTCVLVLQPDADLVQSCAGQVVWSSGTARSDGTPRLVMQPDGDLVEHVTTPAGDDLVVFETGTHVPGSSTVVQDDDRFVVYTPAGDPVYANR